MRRLACLTGDGAIGCWANEGQALANTGTMPSLGHWCLGRFPEVETKPGEIRMGTVLTRSEPPKHSFNNAAQPSHCAAWSRHNKVLFAIYSGLRMQAFLHMYHA